MLTTFNYDWKIRARVTKKGEVKNWRNSRSEGKLLNFDLIDFNGTQITATLFNDAVDKYEELLKDNKVYLLSGGQVKLANQKFTSIKNDFALTFDSKSEIIEDDDDGSIVEQA